MEALGCGRCGLFVGCKSDTDVEVTSRCWSETQDTAAEPEWEVVLGQKETFYSVKHFNLPFPNFALGTLVAQWLTCRRPSQTLCPLVNCCACSLMAKNSYKNIVLFVLRLAGLFLKEMLVSSFIILFLESTRAAFSFYLELILIYCVLSWLWDGVSVHPTLLRLFPFKSASLSKQDIWSHWHHADTEVDQTVWNSVLRAMWSINFWITGIDCTYTSLSA